MSNQLIVIIINGIYLILLTAAFWGRRGSIPVETNENEKLPYHIVGLITVVFYVSFSMFRNSHLFNEDILSLNTYPGYMFVSMFFLQFFLQFLILLLYLIPTNKILRIVHQVSIMLMMGVAIWTGLFRFKPIDENKIELSIKEIRKISQELTSFQEDLSTRIKGVNTNMESILIDLRKKEDDLNELNNILKKKELELEEINSVITLDREKVNDLMNYIEKDVSISDSILNGVYGFSIGVASSYFVLYLPKIRRRKRQKN